MSGRVLVGGSAAGPYLGLRAPISFWGGVDPVTGCVSDPRHPDHGISLQGCVVWISSTVGSSSSSSVLLELLARGLGPAALLLGEVDPILTLGSVVAAELGWPSVPVVHVDARDIQGFRNGQMVQIVEGVIRPATRP